MAKWLCTTLLCLYLIAVVVISSFSIVIVCEKYHINTVICMILFTTNMLLLIGGVYKLDDIMGNKN